MNTLKSALSGPVATLILATAAFVTWVSLHTTPAHHDADSELPVQLRPQPSADLVIEPDRLDGPEPLAAARVRLD